MVPLNFAVANRGSSHYSRELSGVPRFVNGNRISEWLFATSQLGANWDDFSASGSNANASSVKDMVRNIVSG